MKKRIEKWLKETMALACLLLIAMSMTASKKVLFDKMKGQYRIPAIVQCKSGKIIAFTDHRYDGTDIGWGHHLDIVMKTSCDGGETWSENEQMVAQGGSKVATDFNCGHGDAAVVADNKTGELLLMCASGGISYFDSSREQPIMMGRYCSRDEGRTWQGEDVTNQIYKLMPDIKGAFFTSGRMVQSKKIKVGTHYRIYSALATNRGNRVLYSDDFGKTWGVLGAQANAQEAAPKGDEAKVEELPNGDVLLSSRVSSGRYFNIYSYDNAKTAAGRWGPVAFSGAENKGVKASSNACNGELVLAKAKINGKKRTMLLQSVPLGPERTKVAIYYKELKSAADYATPESVAANWEGCYEVSNTLSAYSTMIHDNKGNILFLMEENSVESHYDIVFEKLSMETICGK